MYQGNTFEKYGCTLAAIPCNEKDINTKKELQNLAIKTSHLYG